MTLKTTCFCLGIMVSISLIQNRTSLSSSTDRAAFESATPSPSPTPTSNAMNSKFVVTEGQVRKTFDTFELKGEKQSKVGIGEEKSLTVMAQSALPPQSLVLSMRFLSPLDQAAKFGYELGLVAKNRTPADRKDFEDRMVARIVEQSNKAVFMVKLLPVPDPQLNVPTISFTLLDRNGANISPTTEPHSYAASPNDLFATVVLEEEGQELVFPIADNSGSRISNEMQKMTLTVVVDGQSQGLQYNLK